MNAHELLMAGDYRAAVDACSKSLAKQPDMIAYNERAAAYLHLNDYDRALADYAVAGYLDCADSTVGDYGYKHVAAVLWLKRAYTVAAALWSHTVGQMLKGRFTHSDMAGGVQCGCLLWFAGAGLSKAELREAAEELLVRKLKKRNNSLWPAPVAAFLCGQITEDELRGTVTSTPILRERQACQAEFYVGAHALSLGNGERALAAFRAASRLTKGSIEIEYFLAGHEIENPEPR